MKNNKKKIEFKSPLKYHRMGRPQLFFAYISALFRVHHYVTQIQFGTYYEGDFNTCVIRKRMQNSYGDYLVC